MHPYSSARGRRSLRPWRRSSGVEGWGPGLPPHRLGPYAPRRRRRVSSSSVFFGHVGRRVGLLSTPRGPSSLRVATIPAEGVVALAGRAPAASSVAVEVGLLPGGGVGKASGWLARGGGEAKRPAGRSKGTAELAAFRRGSGSAVGLVGGEVRGFGEGAGGEVVRLGAELRAGKAGGQRSQGMAETSILSAEGLSASDDEIQNLEVSTVQNNKKRLRKDSDAGKKRGVCYLSRVPPHMDPTRLRQILSQYGDIHRIYLVPENPTVQVQRKQVGGFRGKQFSEGWVEFTRRSVAKRVANILNGEQIGGKRRSSFYYDIWNIKYLNKYKWDDLTTETANNNHTREQKLTMEISAAKRERDFYLKKVDQSKALKFMKERMNKKQKIRGESEHVEEAKVVRRFPQNRPVADRAVQNKPGLSKEVLKEVFGSSS